MHRTVQVHPLLEHRRDSMPPEQLEQAERPAIKMIEVV